MSAWTIRIEAETDASAERALRQALKSLPLAEDDSAPYRLEINSEDVSDGPFEGEVNEPLQRSKDRTDALRLTRHDGSRVCPVPPFSTVRVSYNGESSVLMHETYAHAADWQKVAWYCVVDEAVAKTANGRT